MEPSLWVLYSQNIILSNDRISQAEWKCLCCLSFCETSTDLWRTFSCQLMFTSPCCTTCESGVHSAVSAFRIIQVNLMGFKVLDLIQTMQQLNIRGHELYFLNASGLSLHRCQQIPAMCWNVCHAGRHLCKRWAWLHYKGCALQLVQLVEKKNAMERYFCRFL